jgi:TRAP-type C4-dicarboxylate transport system permease small subunit
MKLRLNNISYLLQGVFRRVTQVINGVGSVFLLVMMLLTTADVSLRYFANRPIIGSLELTEFMMVILVFFAMGYTAALRGHIVIHFLTSRLPERYQAIGDSIAYFISIGFCSLISWQAITQAGITQSYYYDLSGVISMSVSPFYCVVAFGSALMCLVFLADLLESLGRWLKK